MIPESIKKQLTEKSFNKAHLDLSNYGLEDEDMLELERLLEDNQQVTSIDLERNNITAKGVKAVAGLLNIQELNLAQNKIDDTGLAYLLKFSKQLARLDIRDNELSEESGKLILTELSKKQNLKQVAVGGNEDISKKIIKQIKDFNKDESCILDRVFSIKPSIDLGNFSQVTQLNNEKLLTSEESTLAKRVVKEHSKEVNEMTPQERGNFVLSLADLLNINIDDFKSNFSYGVV